MSENSNHDRSDGSAGWRWLDGLPQRCQTTLLIRQRINVASEPEGGSITLAVNHLYRLYVNGQYVSRGPARSDPRWPFYDQHDIGKHLRRGDNVIVVVAHHYDWAPFEATGAMNSAWRLFNGPGAICADVRIAGNVTEKGAWEGCLAPGWLDCPERINRFLGYQHEVEVNTFEAALAEACEGRGSNWQPLVAVISDDLGSPTPRPTPDLVEVAHRPTRLEFVKTADAAVENYQAVQRFDLVRPLIVNAEAWLTFDFGRPTGGFPELDLECQDDAHVDVYLGEGGQTRRTDQLHLRAGRVRYQPLDWRGGRTITLHVRALAGSVSIHDVRFIEMVYPFEPRGDFRCSDAALTDVWEICRQTAWSSVKDHPVDCVSREQALWIADVNVHARAVRACFGDMRPIQKALRQSLQAMHADGVMPVPGPCAIGYKRTAKSLPWSEQPLTFAMTLRDLYMFDGSKELVQEAIPRLEAMYRLFEQYEDSRGLLQVSPPGLPSLMVFGGWNPFLKKGVPAALNFEYAISLDAASTLARAIGRTDSANAWERRAERVRRAVVTAFWNDGRAMFIDGELNGEKVEAFSPTVNAWGALAGAVPAHRAGDWAHAITTDVAVMPPVTPLDATLLLEAFARLNLDRYCRALLDDYFGSIVRAGEPTLPEYWIESETGGAGRGDDSSACHPYGAGPAYVLHDVVLGVNPAEPGYRRATIAPRTLGLTEASGRVPTPHGDIQLAWRRTDSMLSMDIELPSAITAQLRLPRLGWMRECLTVNHRKVWEAASSDYEQHRMRGQIGLEGRTVEHMLAGGARYQIVLATG